MKDPIANKAVASMIGTYIGAGIAYLLVTIVPTIILVWAGYTILFLLANIFVYYLFYCSIALVHKE